MTSIGVLGAGSWGTALADLLARAGHDVRMWAYETDVVAAINATHQNAAFLPGVPLAPSLRAVEHVGEAVRGASVVLSAAPSHAVRTVLRGAAPDIADDAIVISATKGLEDTSLARMSQVIADEVAGVRIVVLSGPSFAKEVAERQPTAVVAASSDATAATAVQQLCSTPSFRVYTNDDVIGAELGGALKNVIAVAAGILEGLGLGHNPRAALLTRGLAEITRLGVALGASVHTFAGLAGMGDLVLTATGGLSRNRALGLAVARGETLDSWRAHHRAVAEGANTSRAAAELARRTGAEMPIADEVRAVLFDGKAPGDSVRDLMERELKAEQWQ
jgi:glycerol-3-phosphate dehydrogenase (NAD(P)+)